MKMQNIKPSNTLQPEYISIKNVISQITSPFSDNGIANDDKILNFKNMVIDFGKAVQDITDKRLFKKVFVGKATTETEIKAISNAFPEKNNLCQVVRIYHSKNGYPNINLSIKEKNSKPFKELEEKEKMKRIDEIISLIDYIITSLYRLENIKPIKNSMFLFGKSIIGKEKSPASSFYSSAKATLTAARQSAVNSKNKISDKVKEAEEERFKQEIFYPSILYPSRLILENQENKQYIFCLFDQNNPKGPISLLATKGNYLQIIESHNYSEKSNFCLKTSTKQSVKIKFNENEVEIHPLTQDGYITLISSSPNKKWYFKTINSNGKLELQADGSKDKFAFKYSPDGKQIEIVSIDIHA